MKIYAPVTSANGVWCTVRFRNGVGETDNPNLIRWFRENGYRLEETKVEVEKPLVEPVEPTVEVTTPKETRYEDMTPNELRDYMKSIGLGRKIGNIHDKAKLIKIIEEWR